MKAREVLRAVVAEKKMSNAELAHRLGLTIAACWERVSSPYKPLDMSTKELCPTLRVLGYKVVVIPWDTKTPSGGFEVD